MSYLFTRKGVVIVPKADALTEDDVLLAVLDAAPRRSTTRRVVRGGQRGRRLVAVRSALQDAGLDYDSAEASFLPSVEVPLDADGARKVFRLIEALEDSDEVQNVYANADVSDEVLAEIDA